MPLRLTWTVSIATTSRLGLSSINLTKSLKVLPALAVDSLITGAVNFFLGLI
ncbi:hypothetical protein [Clostridium botulinum]|uniref:hypothetical protein n=1 Tax=Clostridium botulinum TaxID=1491 RepID=UPI0012B40EFE|nr:hypothetical protein [Clostridium botulinum]